MGSSTSDRELFTVSATARRTGITPSTLRNWERRFQAVVPARSEGGQRRYTEGDINRLDLLRTLSERGHAVSELAELPTAELEDLVEKPEREVRAANPIGNERLHVLAVGEHAHESVERAARETPVVRLLHHFTSIDEALVAKTDQLRHADVLVLHMAQLQERRRPLVEALRGRFAPRHVVIVYDFAPSQVVRDMRDQSTSLVEGFEHGAQLLRILAPGMLADLAGPGDSFAAPQFDRNTPRQFAPTELLHLMRDERINMFCECPRHLAEMLLQFYEFESYTRGCSVESPEDARTHEEILVQAVGARSCVEQALNTALTHANAQAGQRSNTVEEVS